MAAGKRTKRGKKELPFDESDLPTVVKAAATAAYDHWRGLAMKGLSSSREEYLSSLAPPVAVGNKAVIILSGDTANAIEQGAPAWDMRTLLNAAGTQEGPNSRYRFIPFTHDIRKAGTGTAPSRRYASVLGRRRRLTVNKAQEVEKDVRDAAKKLRGGGFVDRLAYDVGPKIRGVHAADPFGGMHRVSMKIAGGAKRYVTFRTLSTNSPSGKWMHPGIDSRNFANKTQRWLEKQLPDIVARVVHG